MLLRYERQVAEREQVWSLLCKMAATFKAEDERDRDGRPSWDSAEKVKHRSAHFKATVVATDIAGCRR